MKRLSWERENYQERQYMALLNRLSAEIKKKQLHIQKKKVVFYLDNAPCYKWMKIMVTLDELRVDSVDYCFFADMKMRQGKEFGSDEEVITQTEAYFESKDKSLYIKGIEKLRGALMYHS